MITLSTWFAMGGAAGACTIGVLAVMAAALAPGRDSTPQPAAGRSHPLPRPGYVILAEPGQVAPWQAATHPEPWPAVPDRLHSAQLA